MLARPVGLLRPLQPSKRLAELTWWQDFERFGRQRGLVQPRPGALSLGKRQMPALTEMQPEAELVAGRAQQRLGLDCHRLGVFVAIGTPAFERRLGAQTGLFAGPASKRPDEREGL